MRRLVIIAIALLAACGGDKGTGPNVTTVSGLWHLRTVNGANLPFVTIGTNGTFSLTGSDLTITGNGSGTYNEVIAYRQVTAGSTTTGTLTEVGTWFSNGGTITFNDQTDKVTYQGSVTDNALTEINGGTTFVYSR